MYELQDFYEIKHIGERK